MDSVGFTGFIILLACTAFSYQGFRDYEYFRKYAFRVDDILYLKDYKRLFTSGFLHVSWMHLIFNMLTLYFFSEVELYVGIFQFLVIYFGSLLGGNLFSLYVHRNHPDYSAVGASGAISGVVFAAIALFPGMKLGLILIPIMFPAWLFGLIYVLYSIYGIKTQRDNIGHEAHLGGGVVGLLIAAMFHPNVWVNNTLPIVLILVPTLIFIYLMVNKPEMMLIDKFFQRNSTKITQTFEDKYHEAKRDQEMTLDELLEKIHRSGYRSLSQKEKDLLDKLSK